MGASTAPLHFTVFTSTVPARLGKRLYLADGGKIEKSASAKMVKGDARVESVCTLHDLAARLDQLGTDQAIAWGVPIGGDAQVVPVAQLPQHPGAIARSKSHFEFPDGPGIMMLDHDGVPDSWSELPPDELRACLIVACPALADAPMLIRPSSSSGVQTVDGSHRTPRRSRVYVPVSSAAGIVEAGARLFELLWAQCFGWCKVSDAGAVLYRTLIDAEVWGAWKYDLVSAPELGDGLIRVPTPPVIYGDPAGRFDLSRICVSDEKRKAAQEHRRRASEAVASEAALTFAAFVERKASEMAQRNGGTVDDARRALSAAASKRELMGDYVVTLGDESNVTVADLQANPGKYDRVKMYDPLEPDGDPRIATAYLDGRTQTIHSHAHGGVTYTLVRDAASVGFGVGVTLPPGPSITPLPIAAPAPDPHPPRNYGILPDDPLSTAKTLVQMRYEHADGARLKAWQESFYRWESSRWREMKAPDVKADLYDFLDRHGESFYRPNQTKVNALLDALRAAAHLDSTLQPPCWIAGAALAPAAELVPCANGMLHLSSRALIAPTPRFFNLGAVPFNFDLRAPAPAQWLRFLATVWPDDPEAVATLQELFGYLLTPDTSQQKIFLIVGPKRSGKGTIARVLTEMLGPENVAGPTLASMATPFGLQPLVGTLAAIISDARLGGRTDQKEVAENLLRISGEDRIEIGRKFLPSLTMRLGTRFVILTNELPRIADASGAMASRFVILTMRESFIGREDPGLTSRLLTELPGILAWAVDGWHRLRARGYFVEPKSSAGAAQELADLGSPIGAFVRDECECAPDAEVEMGAMFTQWRYWCGLQGVAHSGSAQTFGRDLRAAFPSITQARPRTGGERVRVYRGVRLRGPLWSAAHPIAVSNTTHTSAIAQ